jgi:NAD+ diphosphatase
LLSCTKCHFVFYQNSKPTASAFITNQKGQILLVKRAIQPKLGWWDMPGGFLEEGEDPVTGVKREIKEELDVRLKNIQLLGIYMDSYAHCFNVHTLNIIYTAQIQSGTIKAMDDVGDTHWFDTDDIPWSRFAFPVWMKPAIRDWLKLGL